MNFSRICRKSEVPYASWLKCEKRQVEIVVLKLRESYLKLYRGTSKGCKKTSLWIAHKLRQFRKRKRGRGWRFGSWIKLFSLFSVSKLEQQHFIHSLKLLLLHLTPVDGMIPSCHCRFWPYSPRMNFLLLFFQF